MIFFDSIYLGDFMFMDYNELKTFVINGLFVYKDNGIEAFLNYLDSCEFINNIVDFINISEDISDNDIKYNVNFIDNYIGTMISQLTYNTNSKKTRYNILKYLLMTNSSIISEFLYSLLDINRMIIAKEENLDLKLKSKLVYKGKNQDILNDDIHKVDCKLDYYVYNGAMFVGLFNLNCYGYFMRDNNNFYNAAKSLEKNLEINDSDKIFVLKKLQQYNRDYIKKLQA